jgi:hypothetical protein
LTCLSFLTAVLIVSFPSSKNETEFKTEIEK